MYYIQHKKTGYYIGSYIDGGIRTVYERANAEQYKTKADAEQWLEQLNNRQKRQFAIVKE